MQIAAAGGGTSYALTADGSVYAWGYNYYGQLGTNTTSGESANVYPVKIQKVSNIIQITAQEISVMMLDADGSVWATGYNNYGGLGIGHSSDVSLPQQMLDTDRSVLYGVKEISGGRYHAVIMKEDNTVWGVGYNGYGQVGDGTTSNRTIISQAKNSAGEVITDAKHIMASGDGTYVTRQKTEDGKPQGMYAVGRNNYGQLFTKDTSTKYKVVEVEKDKDIIAGTMTLSNTTQTGAIVDQDGMVYTVGLNDYGQMGNGTIESLITPWCISKLKIKVNPKIINYKNIGENSEKITYEMTMGFNLIKDTIEGGTYKFSSLDKNVATVDENTGVVTAQGIGTTYIKVYNEENNVWSAVKVNVNGKEGSVQPKIAGGNYHFVSLKANGTVWTWGLNSNGQLG